MNDLERRAPQLPAAERERLARNLFERVHNKEITDIDKAWIAVAEERSDAYRSGADAGIDEASFFALVQNTFK
jgi:hypothetical protein